MVQTELNGGYSLTKKEFLCESVYLPFLFLFPNRIILKGMTVFKAFSSIWRDYHLKVSQWWIDMTQVSIEIGCESCCKTCLYQSNDLKNTKLWNINGYHIMGACTLQTPAMSHNICNIIRRLWCPQYLGLFATLHETKFNRVRKSAEFWPTNESRLYECWLIVLATDWLQAQKNSQIAGQPTVRLTSWGKLYLVQEHFYRQVNL